ncbi:fumarylacetoacetate hydrolase family protein [Ruicaihuangia caeni]|uniref:fumarylacetoacetate hydrolase family protein n=1 Tax=Ruicaihuangia caeni TaxID=3042517 RepID=UPI00338F2D66
MKLASFEYDGRPCWGVLEGDGVRLVCSASAARDRTLGQVLREGDLERVLDDARGASVVAVGEILFLPPVTDAEKIICIGLNYADHVREMNRPMPEKPVVFTRFNDSLVGGGAPLVAPRASDQFDYEGELAVVIGKGGRNIAPEDAMQHVLGYTMMNDGSMRDYQRHTHQFGPGKNFPRSGSLGPAIVTADETGPLGNRRISTRVNGETVQQSSLDQLVFDVAALIAYCSEWTQLNAGDVIATGTPGGVGDGREPKLFLKHGDVVEVEVDGLGVLSNPVVGER